MLAAFATILVAAGGVALGVFALRSMAGYPDPEHSPPPERVPFLGGHEPGTHAWSRFHARYYPMTLLFIAVEMEMMFMYPWAVVYVAEGGKALVEMGMFLGLLSLGVLYGWREGVFEWQ